MIEQEESASNGSGDLRSTIEAALKEAHAQDAADFGDAPSDEVEAPVEAEATATERARDEHGRFAKKQVSDQAEDPRQPEALEPIQPPKSWSADQQERFKALPRETQEYLAKREGERESIIGQKSDKAARYERQWEPVERELQQYRRYFESSGITPQEAISRLFRAQAELDSDPATAIRHIAQTYGVDLSKIAQQSASPQTQQSQTHTPEIQEFRQFITEYRQAQAEERIRGLAYEVQEFSQAKDQGGNLLRPHMEKVADAMMGHVQFFRARHPDLSNQEVLEKAYRHAVLDSPEIAQEEAKRADSQRIADAKAKAVAAKRAGASLGGGNPGGGMAQVQTGSLRDTLLAARRGEL